MTARRAVQSVLSLALCAVALSWLGALYAFPAILTTLIAMSTRVYALLAIAAGFVWPVLVLAYVLYVTRSSKLRSSAPHHRPRRPAPGEPGLFGVEDP